MTMVSSGSSGTTSPSSEDGAASPGPSRTRQARRKPTGFRMNGCAKELHGSAIYSIAWSTDVFQDDTPLQQDTDSDRANEHTNEALSEEAQPPQRQVRYVATCGGNHVTVYEVEVPSGRTKRTDGLTLRQAYVDPDKDEVLYSCVFGGRSLGRPFGYAPVSNGGVPIVLGDEKENHGGKPLSGETRAHEDVSQGSEDSLTTDELGSTLFQTMTDMQSFDGPQLLCIAGTRGVIKVIDTVRQMLAMTLSGHGKDIDDLKFSPANEWLLLSASKDESIRLWNVKNATCVAIFAGHEGHRDNVLAIAWHPSGHRFASAGMDTTVKLWNTGEGTNVHRAIQASNSVQAQTWDSSAAAASLGRFRMIYEQMPYFSTNKIHTDYVDCVRFVGDLVLSKSTGGTVVLWKPQFTWTVRHATSKPTHQRLPNEVIALREFTMNKCDVWFMRFHMDIDCRMLAIGNVPWLPPIYCCCGCPRAPLLRDTNRYGRVNFVVSNKESK